MRSRALSLAAVTVLIGLFGVEIAPAQNLDAGKPPARLFSDNCSGCHRTSRGLLKTVPAGSLSGFLRQHYTTSGDMASALSGYLLSGGGAADRVAAPTVRDPRRDAKQEPDARETLSPTEAAAAKKLRREQRAAARKEAADRKAGRKGPATPETNPPEPAQSEPGNPAQPETAKTEPNKSEPAKTEPAGGEPAKTEPAGTPEVPAAGTPESPTVETAAPAASAPVVAQPPARQQRPSGIVLPGFPLPVTEPDEVQPQPSPPPAVAPAPAPAPAAPAVVPDPVLPPPAPEPSKPEPAVIEKPADPSGPDPAATESVKPQSNATETPNLAIMKETRRVRGPKSAQRKKPTAEVRKPRSKGPK